MCFSYRTLDVDIEPRYLHPDFKKKSGALFSEHNFEVDRGWVNVVEGPLDCIWMWQCGFPNTLAFLGTPSKQQMINLLSWGDKFNLCLDNDGPGQEVTKRLEEFISSHNKIVKTTALPVEAKDVQEVDKITLSTIIRRNTHN
jgi:DNA primase